MASRIVTVRLSEEQVVALETIASFDGVALAEELREGVQLLIAARRSDSEFHARVQASFEKARLILEGVEGGEAVIEALRPAAEAAAAAQKAAAEGDEAVLPVAESAVAPETREAEELVSAERLAEIPLFASLSTSDREQLAVAATEVEVEEGKRLAEDGRFAYELVAIEEGTADVLQEGKKLHQLGPGDSFGEIGLLGAGRRAATVVATSPMRLIAILGPQLRGHAEAVWQQLGQQGGSEHLY
jgi:Cyclic nucleotide-binding domain